MSPQENTKIERIVEAVESLAISVAHGIMAAENVETRSRKADPLTLAENRKDARDELKTALQEFLRPALRVIDRTEEYNKNKAELDRVRYPNGIDDIPISH